MKFKKTLAGIAAAAMAATTVSAFSFGASAIGSGTVIDFEDGDFSFVYMNVDSGADDSVLSVEDYDGSKQLKVDVQDCKNVPKVWFDLDKITDRSNAVQIKTIEMDLTLVPKNAEEAIGWAGGAIGSAGAYGDQVDPAWSDGAWSCEDNNAYTAGAAAKQHITRKFLLGSQMYTETGASPFFGLMRWASETNYVMYIDNIVLKTKDGDALPVGFAPVAETEAPAEETAAETEAAAEETTVAETEAAVETEAPAETEAAAPAPVVAGSVICDTEATSDGAWGQAITLTTLKNEGGVFDPACLTPDKAVVVYYEADTAPEVVLQSWSGGEGWAKVPADETLSSDGVAVFTYEYMTAMYQSEDFVTTLDAFIVGDTGSALKVSKVELVDLASLTGEAAVEAPVEEDAAEETPAETEAAPAVEETTPVADTTTPVASTGNTAVASIATVMALAGAAALISKRK